MDHKKITLKNVSAVEKNEKNHKYNRFLRNMDIEIIDNSIISIISNDEHERNILGKIIEGNLNIDSGTRVYEGSYFNNQKLYKGKKIEYITTEVVQGIRNDISVSDYLFENLKNHKKLKSSYKQSYNETKEKINTLEKRMDELNDDKKYLLRKAERNSEKYRSVILEKIPKLKEENEKNIAIKEKERELKSKEKLVKKLWIELDKENTDSKKVYLGKEFSHKRALKNFIKKIKLIKKNEHAEINKGAIDEERDIDNLIYGRAAREMNNLIKYLGSIKIKLVTLDKTYLTRLNRILEISNRKKFFSEIKSAIKEIESLANFANDEIKSELVKRATFIKKILDPKAAINSKHYNTLLNLIYERYEQRINYFNNVIKDIELMLKVIEENDRHEKSAERRKLWEYKIVSLRFQSQVFKERNQFLQDKINNIESVSLTHSKDNFNEIYDLIIETEKLKTDIAIALNRWRFQRELGLHKIDNLAKEEVLNREITDLRKQIKKLKGSLKFKGLFNDYVTSYVREFSNKAINRAKRPIEITEEERNWIANEIEKTEDEIIKYTDVLNELEAKLDTKDLEKEELRLTYLLEDISFSWDNLDLKIGSTSVAQRQRLSLVKAALEGKEVIMIESPKYDLDLKADSEIAKSILKISKRSNMMIILLTDDFKLAKEVSNRVAFTYRGTVFEKGDFNTVTKNPLHPYTKWIIKKSLDTNFSMDDEFHGERLQHSIFTPLKNINVTKDHILLATEYEYEKWKNNK